MFSSEEIAKATTEEKAAAFDRYAAYYGTYTIDEAAGTITHHDGSEVVGASEIETHHKVSRKLK